jgi:hypothetical protein
MITINKHLKYVSILLLFIMIINLISGCENQSGYKTFSFKKNDIRFIIGGVILEHPLFCFDYPQDFNFLDMNGLQDFKYNPGDTQVDFSRHGSSNEKYLDESNISIEVFKPGYSGFPGVIDAKTGIEYTINGMNARNVENSFRLLEHNSKEVAGIFAEFIDYLVFQNVGELNLDHETRMVIFDYKGFIWEISIYSPIEQAQKEGHYFDHLLQTFKFLAQYPEGLNNVPESTNN